MNRKQELEAAKKEYFYNKRISYFIDTLVEQTHDNIDPNLLTGYVSEFVELIIKEFWISGRAIFDYPCEDYYQIVKLYDPKLLRIYPIPDSLRCKIIYGNKDISDKVLLIARRKNSFDWLGSSIIKDNNKISSFGLEDFNNALSNAIDIFNRV